MERPNMSEMEFQLRKLLVRYSELFASQQWPSEGSRWVELLFALISRITCGSEDEIRAALEELDSLDLLDIKVLSRVGAPDGAVDRESPHTRRIAQVLSESGFTEEECQRSVLVMHEAAKSLTEHHGGKVQRYLRKYGQRMIDELGDNFSFSSMGENDVKRAFTYWLQNVLDMPLLSEDESIQKFCRKLGKKSGELVEAADRLDINLAIVDDVIQMYLSDQSSFAQRQQLEQEKGVVKKREG